MKNVLNYYYGIILSDSPNDNGYFSYNNHLFCLHLYQRNINEIDSLLLLNNYMIQKGIYVNKIIVNNMNQVITIYEGKAYVLLLIKYQHHLEYFHFFLSPVNNKLNILKRNDWDKLWSIKIDYIEYQIKHLENSYPLLTKSVNYYIGMAENAISYFKMLNLHHMPLYINHRRINIKDLYNPLELVIDYKVRDLAEYIKEAFIYKEKTIFDIKKILNSLNLSNIDYILLYNRMLYPSFYFDIYEKILNDNFDEKSILEIIDQASNYEEFLYDMYSYIRKRTNILGIDWINSKF